MTKLPPFASVMPLWLNCHLHKIKSQDYFSCPRQNLPNHYQSSPLLWILLHSSRITTHVFTYYMFHSLLVKNLKSLRVYTYYTHCQKNIRASMSYKYLLNLVGSHQTPFSSFQIFNFDFMRYFYWVTTSHSTFS